MNHAYIKKHLLVGFGILIAGISIFMVVKPKKFICLVGPVVEPEGFILLIPSCGV